MIGKIFIKNLLVKTVIGVGAPERSKKQNILINVAVWADVSKAIKSNDIADTINYRVIQDKILYLADVGEYILLENFADKIITACFDDTRIKKVLVRVEKPNKFPESESVGVEIEKSR